MVSLSPPCPKHRHSPLLTSCGSTLCTSLQPSSPPPTPLGSQAWTPHSWLGIHSRLLWVRHELEARVVVSATPPSTTPPLSVRRPLILSTTPFGDPPRHLRLLPFLAVLPTIPAPASLSCGQCQPQSPLEGSWACLPFSRAS